ncbi:ABC transporter permease [Fuchsiella alkaliacetigena]|uniref:ABC transporter permease n=1 Tax=Fuchsiella alkaliacetigena TaxID=957042 RepID=UPI00200A27F5|nr:ABC transporter permease [Fuchsiella alkaliacetigena]MCK8823692.1 ABC transporter permease [Fuchsiella alkaliacetigena]
MNFKRVSIGIVLTSFLIYAVLIISLFYFFDIERFAEIIFSRRVLFSLRLSLITATISTLISVIIAIPAAYALSRFDFVAKDLIDTLFELPMVVSPAALGAMLLIFFNNPLGSWIQDNYIRFVFTASGIVLAQFITILGIAIRLVKAVLDEIPERYEKVARSLGSSSFNSFMTITFPLAKRGIFASGILVWAKALGEFGATITIAGTMAMQTETLPVAIFMRISVADITGAMSLILILIIVGLGTLYGVRIFWRESLYD